MRRNDREMPEAFGWAVADKCEWAVLGLIDADGEVYPVPVTIVREGSRVYFHSAQSGEKVECLRRHPRVSLCCIGDTNRGAFGNFTTEYDKACLVFRQQTYVLVVEIYFSLFHDILFLFFLDRNGAYFLTEQQEDLVCLVKS